MLRVRPSRSAGFSLVELLVALVFISFLMAGMLRIYGSAIQGFAAANESVKAQRDNRASMQQIEDDLSAAGFQFPNATVGVTINTDTTAGQNPVMLFPGKTMVVKDVDQAAPTAAPTNETLTFDELQYITDVPLPVTAHLTAVPALGATSIDIAFTQGSFADLQPGDMLVLLDAQSRRDYDKALVGTGLPTGTAGTLPLGSASAGNPNSGSVSSTGGGGLNFPDQHLVNAEIYFIRPNQVIRYTLMPLALDPANTNATVACLVRDQAVYPADGSRIVWPASTASGAGLVTGAGSPVTRTVVAENVSGLRFDISADRGATWLRGASWPATSTALDAALATQAAANPGLNYATTTQGAGVLASWYRYAPVLFRADITTRTVLKRSDYSATANTAAYRTRTQTLLVQPRNFGLDILP